MGEQNIAPESAPIDVPIPEDNNVMEIENEEQSSQIVDEQDIEIVDVNESAPAVEAEEEAEDPAVENVAAEKEQVAEKPKKKKSKKSQKSKESKEESQQENCEKEKSCQEKKIEQY